MKLYMFDGTWPAISETEAGGGGFLRAGYPKGQVRPGFPFATQAAGQWLCL